VSQHARKQHIVLPLAATLSGAEVVGGPARVELGQLEGRLQMRFNAGNDGTPDRTLVTWVVRGAAGTRVNVAVSHPRAGSRQVTLVLG
jgi:hypothetical protein